VIDVDLCDRGGFEFDEVEAVKLDEEVEVERGWGPVDLNWDSSSATRRSK